MLIYGPMPCPHPPERYFCWWAGEVFCMGCCACGEVLAGDVGLEERDPEAFAKEQKQWRQLFGIKEPVKATVRKRSRRKKL